MRQAILVDQPIGWICSTLQIRPQRIRNASSGFTYVIPFRSFVPVLSANWLLLTHASLSGLALLVLSWTKALSILLMKGRCRLKCFRAAVDEVVTESLASPGAGLDKLFSQKAALCPERGNCRQNKPRGALFFLILGSRPRA